MAKTDLIGEVIKASPSQRKMIKTLGMASAAATAMFAVGDTKLSAAPSTPSAADILQFALNLEYLEAEFYTYAQYGNGIDSHGIGITGSGSSSATTGGSKVNFSNNFVFTGQIAAEIGADERAHVKLLRAALSGAGVTPVAKPPIKLDALGIGFANEYSFLQLARIFEDVGVTAYGYLASLLLQPAPTLGPRRASWRRRRNTWETFVWKLPVCLSTRLRSTASISRLRPRALSSCLWTNRLD